jgi:hypothetical protein
MGDDDRGAFLQSQFLNKRRSPLRQKLESKISFIDKPIVDTLLGEVRSTLTRGVRGAEEIGFRRDRSLKFFSRSRRPQQAWH